MRCPPASASNPVRRGRPCAAVRSGAAARCPASGTDSSRSMVSSATVDVALPALFGGAADEIVHEGRDLVPPFAQRLDRQRHDIQAVEEVFAEFPVAHQVFEIPLVAATMRTLTLSVAVSPSGEISPDSRKRRSFGWRSSPSSPISSRKRVPPSAARMRPEWSRSAPVKAPRRWPNSWLSSSSRGTAAQLTGMKGFGRAVGTGVNGVGDDLLAGSALAGDQNDDRCARRRGGPESSARACGRKRRPRSPSTGSSSIGQSVARSSRSARARWSS